MTGANTHDSRKPAPLLDTDPGVRERRGLPGRARRRPGKLHADKGYDYPRCRRYLARRGIGVRMEELIPLGTESHRAQRELDAIDWVGLTAGEGDS